MATTRDVSTGVKEGECAWEKEREEERRGEEGRW
jgi:hypothetical protein